MASSMLSSAPMVTVYARHLHGAARLAVLVWFGLIAFSPLLTHQHHVIDILGGFALGAGCLVFIRPKFCLDSGALSP